MGNLTKDQQRKAVAEGLALGTLALGVRAVTAAKLELEFALGDALRHWSYVANYQSLSGHDGPENLWMGIQKSERRKMTFAAWSSEGPWLEPYITMEDWTVEECTEILAKDGVPHEGWIELARGFVEHLGEDRIRR